MNIDSIVHEITSMKEKLEKLTVERDEWKNKYTDLEQHVKVYNPDEMKTLEETNNKMRARLNELERDIRFEAKYKVIESEHKKVIKKLELAESKLKDIKRVLGRK